ncbi:MAG: cytidylate kinase family protein [Deltaproteobacteria bacterium]|nr:cytidylate kinase family protein [Deltaproteobacteria bacterium]
MALLTITAGIGSESLLIAQHIANRLSVRLYDDDRLQQEFLDMGLSLKDIESLDEKAPGFFNRLLDLKPKSYQELLESVVYRVAQRGEGVIIGHGSPFLLQDFGCALHVRIYSSETQRVKRIAQEWKIDEINAQKAIRKSDSDRRGFMEYAFNISWDDPGLYDLIVNTDKLGYETAAEMIIAVASSDIINSCSLTALETMKRYSLEKRIEAVVKKTLLVPKNVQVSVTDDGHVTLTGVMNPLESQDRLLDAVRSVPGVIDIAAKIASEKIHDI